MTEEIEIVEGSAGRPPTRAIRAVRHPRHDRHLWSRLRGEVDAALVNALVDRDMFPGTQQIRASLPDELRAARWMVRGQAFIARTNEGGDRQQGQEADRRLESTSSPRPERPTSVRRAEASRHRLEAEDLIEKSLQKAESVLTNLVAELQQSRLELHEARPKAPEVPL